MALVARGDVVTLAQMQALEQKANPIGQVLREGIYRFLGNFHAFDGARGTPKDRTDTTKNPMIQQWNVGDYAFDYTAYDPQSPSVFKRPFLYFYTSEESGWINVSTGFYRDEDGNLIDGTPNFTHHSILCFGSQGEMFASGAAFGVIAIVASDVNPSGMTFDEPNNGWLPQHPTNSGVLVWYNLREIGWVRYGGTLTELNRLRADMYKGLTCATVDVRAAGAPNYGLRDVCAVSGPWCFTARGPANNRNSLETAAGTWWADDMDLLYDTSLGNVEGLTFGASAKISREPTSPTVAVAGIRLEGIPAGSSLRITASLALRSGGITLSGTLAPFATIHNTFDVNTGQGVSVIVIDAQVGGSGIYDIRATHPAITGTTEKQFFPGGFYIDGPDKYFVAGGADAFTVSGTIPTPSRPFPMIVDGSGVTGRASRVPRIRILPLADADTTQPLMIEGQDLSLPRVRSDHNNSRFSISDAVGSPQRLWFGRTVPPRANVGVTQFPQFFRRTLVPLMDFSRLVAPNAWGRTQNPLPVKPIGDPSPPVYGRYTNYHGYQFYPVYYRGRSEPPAATARIRAGIIFPIVVRRLDPTERGAIGFSLGYRNPSNGADVSLFTGTLPADEDAAYLENDPIAVSFRTTTPASVRCIPIWCSTTEVQVYPFYLPALEKNGHYTTGSEANPYAAHIDAVRYTGGYPFCSLPLFADWHNWTDRMLDQLRLDVLG